MLRRLMDLIRRGLTGASLRPTGPGRKVLVADETPSDRFILIVALMVIFFAGLIALQISYMMVFHEWSEAIFNGIMLVVGTIVGAVWGRSS